MGKDVSLSTLVKVLGEVAAERARQDAKWGEQNHPDGTGPDWRLAGCPAPTLLDMVRRELDRTLTDQVDVSPDGMTITPATGPTWLLIALEEVFEALVEVDKTALRAELVQAAAVLVAWVQKLDRERGRADGSDPEVRHG